MSEKNRRAEYDRLKAADKDIPEVLVNEFGDPAQTKEEPPEFETPTTATSKPVHKKKRQLG